MRSDLKIANSMLDLIGDIPLVRLNRIGQGTGTEILVKPEFLNPSGSIKDRIAKTMIEELPSVFNWMLLDSPPLLFAADANLLATLCDGTIMVVKIGVTTFDSVTRAIQSLCENNVLGIVANGARAGELYSKYTYYYSSYYYKDRKEKREEEE